jgi:hypothetical protein
MFTYFLDHRRSQVSPCRCVAAVDRYRRQGTDTWANGLAEAAAVANGQRVTRPPTRRSFGG